MCALLAHTLVAHSNKRAKRNPTIMKRDVYVLFSGSHCLDYIPNMEDEKLP